MTIKLRSCRWIGWPAAGLGLLGLFAAPARAFADNPIVQTSYTADPAPMVHDDRVYVYTSHDEDETVDNFFTMNDWQCYSSVDMVNWTDHGSPLSYHDFSWSSGDAWAGQVVHRDGQFFFYVPLTNRATNRKVIGVAVADNPLGPFHDALGEPLIADSYDIDPTVFIDDDGQAYLYWGNPDLLYVRLNPDMVSYSGEIERVPMTTESFGTRLGDAERPTLFEEGPWLYKRADLYYLLFAAECCSPEKIDYSTSDQATGPWTYGGRIMNSAGSASFTNHPGVVEYRERNYLFYHNGALPGGGGFRRSVGVEEFEYNADGTIPTIPMTDEGPDPLATLDPFLQNEAETIAFSSGLKTEPCSEGGMNVTSIDDGDYIKVANVDFGRGITSLDVRVAAESSCGSIEVHLDSVTGPLVGSCPIQSTGGSQLWQTQTCAMEGATGVNDLFLRFTGGCGLFQFNWWRFNGPGADGPDEPGDSDSDSDDVDGTDTQDAVTTLETSDTLQSTTAVDSGTSGPASTTGPSMDGTSRAECMNTCSETGGDDDSTSASATVGSSETGDETGTGTASEGAPSGCSCQTGRGGPSSALALFLSMVVLRRRRLG